MASIHSSSSGKYRKNFDLYAENLNLNESETHFANIVRAILLRGTGSTGLNTISQSMRELKTIAAELSDSDGAKKKISLTALGILADKRNNLDRRVATMEASSSSASSSAEFEAKAYEYAVDKKLGWKAGRLLAWRDKLEEEFSDKTHISVGIPPLMCCNSPEVWTELCANIDGLEKLWGDFLGSISQENKENIRNGERREGYQLNYKSLGALAEITRRLRGYYQTHTSSHERILEWAQTEGIRQVAVRSSGMEDTINMPNAGGNESVLNVNAHEPEALSSAIGTVISSYFSRSSIEQRIRSGDSTILDSTPMVSFFAQMMINSTNEQPAVGGVLFTGDKQSAELANGLTAGIVSGQVPTSTLSRGCNDSIHSSVRWQEERVMSDPNGGVLTEQNPFEAAQAKKISDTEARFLFQVGDVIDRDFGLEARANDVEFLFIPGDGDRKSQLHILQVRPLVQQEEHPSYIDGESINHIPSESIVPVTTLLDGGGGVCKIESAEHILFANTMEEAEAILRDSSDPEKIHLIVLKKESGTKSHAAVNLSSKGYAVVQVADEKLQEKIRSFSDGSLLVDVQRGLLLPMSGEEAIRQGRVLSARRLEYTIPILPTENLEVNVEALVERLKLTAGDSWRSLEKGGAASSSESQTVLPSIRKRLELVAHSRSKQEAYAHLGALIQHMKTAVEIIKHSWGAEGGDGVHETEALLATAIRHCQQEVVPAIRNHEPSSRERLDAVRVLETICFQQENSNVARSFSLSSLLNWVVAGLSYQGNTTERKILDAFGKQMVSQKDRSLWSQILEYAPPETLKACTTMIVEGRRIGIIDDWISKKLDAFDEGLSDSEIDELSSDDDSDSEIDELSSDDDWDDYYDEDRPTPIDAAAQEFVKIWEEGKEDRILLQPIFSKITNARSRIDKLNDLSTQKAHIHLVRNLVTDVITGITTNENSSLTRSLTVINLLHSTMELIDDSLKAIQACHHDSTDPKANMENFEQVLNIYKNFFREILNFSDTRKTFTYFAPFDWISYQWYDLRSVDEILNRLLPGWYKQTYDISPNFDVSERLWDLPAKTVSEQSLSLSLGDSFTAIHQNIELLLSKLRVEVLGDPTLSEVGESFHSVLEFSNIDRSHAIPREVFKKRLRSHGVCIWIENEPTVRVGFILDGKNEGNRFEVLEACFAILLQRFGIELSSPSYGNLKVEYIFDIPDGFEHMDDVAGLLEHVIDSLYVQQYEPMKGLALSLKNDVDALSETAADDAIKKLTHLNLREFTKAIEKNIYRDQASLSKDFREALVNFLLTDFCLQESVLKHLEMLYPPMVDGLIANGNWKKLSELLPKMFTSLTGEGTYLQESFNTGTIYFDIRRKAQLRSLYAHSQDILLWALKELNQHAPELGRLCIQTLMENSKWVEENGYLISKSPLFRSHSSAASSS